ncbi:hypothetical protein PHYSODRAFT_515755, partial [Phytophthora sojae]
QARSHGRARLPPALLDRNGQIHYHVERWDAESLQNEDHGAHGARRSDRRLHGKLQLLVKWRGYPESDNSWGPVEQLQADCPKAVVICDEKQRQLRK